ncbi:hypothetical protein BD410DRAFT_824634, partial [Rickenella mellea]
MVRVQIYGEHSEQLLSQSDKSSLYVYFCYYTVIIRSLCWALRDLQQLEKSPQDSDVLGAYSQAIQSIIMDELKEPWHHSSFSDDLTAEHIAMVQELLENPLAKMVHDLLKQTAENLGYASMIAALYIPIIKHGIIQAAKQAALMAQSKSKLTFRRTERFRTERLEDTRWRTRSTKSTREVNLHRHLHRVLALRHQSWAPCLVEMVPSRWQFGLNFVAWCIEVVVVASRRDHAESRRGDIDVGLPHTEFELRTPNLVMTKGVAAASSETGGLGRVLGQRSLTKTWTRVQTGLEVAGIAVFSVLKATKVTEQHGEHEKCHLAGTHSYSQFYLMYHCDYYWQLQMSCELTPVLHVAFADLWCGCSTQGHLAPKCCIFLLGTRKLLKYPVGGGSFGGRPYPKSITSGHGFFFCNP